ncbi:hypothetical protein MiAbW_00315 [Microcystis aeruginosa NIES-4325]|uniref:Uncharacterized protein n=1 Tax=Microcystis aeruginosa NIES-4325 TaxID=2569534 RepID=A0A5J4F3W3_MICAE|nr:hypothetical protein MiAbW_00315 [Microcystis aeruginosa NIES-4325]
MSRNISQYAGERETECNTADQYSLTLESQNLEPVVTALSNSYPSESLNFAAFLYLFNTCDRLSFLPAKFWQIFSQKKP